MKCISCVLVVLAVLFFGVSAQADLAETYGTLNGNFRATTYQYTPNLAETKGTVNGKYFEATTYQYTPKLSETYGTVNGRSFRTTTYNYSNSLSDFSELKNMILNK